MEIKIYQIDLDRDWNDIAFMPFDGVVESEIDPVSYDCVYDGEFPARNLEEVFANLNSDNTTDGYIGRSMSISDVCEVIKDGKSEFFYVDSVGFQKIDFNASLTRAYREPNITAIACYPGKTAEVITLPNTLKAKQNFVGGYIEAVYPFADPVAIICNEEGKINGLPANRALYDEEGKMFDIVSGPMLIVGLTEDDFGSLRGELREKYLNQFKHPEVFVRVGREVMAFKVPEQSENIEKQQNHMKHK